MESRETTFIPLSAHQVLARSYMSFFIAATIGIFADLFFTTSFSVPYASLLATLFFILGPLLMFWAQMTSWRCQQQQHSSYYFRHGPYRFVRNPTQLGILITISGYTIVSGSLLFFVASAVGFFVSNIFFKRYESINDQVHGEKHEDYKKHIPKL